MDAGRVNDFTGQFEIQTIRILNAQERPDDMRNRFLELQKSINEIGGDEDFLLLLYLTNFMREFHFGVIGQNCEKTYNKPSLARLFRRDPSNPDVVFGYAMQLRAENKVARARQLLVRLTHSRFRLWSLAEDELKRLQ